MDNDGLLDVNEEINADDDIPGETILLKPGTTDPLAPLLIRCNEDNDQLINNSVTEDISHLDIGCSSNETSLTLIESDDHDSAASVSEASQDFNCFYCEIKFSKKHELDTHCQSDLHKKKLTSDDLREWTYRPPPRGLAGDEYALCAKFLPNGRCPFGDKCTQAHSKEELNEWRERFEFRKQKLLRAKEKDLHGNTLAEKLVEKLLNTEQQESVLAQTLDYVKLHVNSDLKVTTSSKKCTNSWTFTVTSKICIQHLLLLDDSNRSHFHISNISVGPKKTQKYQNLENHCQEWSNPDVDNKGPGEYVYRVKLMFKTDIFGTFHQTLVADFGSDPMLSREVTVESSPITGEETLHKDLEILLDANRWNEQTVDIVEFQPMPLSHASMDKQLLAQYPVVQQREQMNLDILMNSPEPDNYKNWMHEMLYIEEIAQFGCIARLNVNASIQIVDRFILIPGTMSTAKYAQNGELYARMRLENNLCEDTKYGRLILQSSHLAWIASYDKTKKSAQQTERVYEAIIEDKGKNFIFFRLSKKCVSEMELKKDHEVMVQVQFQLNRMPKCEMHAALDKLQVMSTLFPADDHVKTPMPEMSLMEELDSRLNDKQRAVIRGIMADRSVPLPPILLIGPYGTGKTFTLAQSTKQVLLEKGTRILICTHSNSAADLYIRDFLHPYVLEGREDARPLRIYYRHRWMQTVSEEVLHYCLLDESGTQAGAFRPPTLKDVEKHRIIVTTLSTCTYLINLDLPPDFFTHVFLDEAAQAMECESVIPMCLVGEGTRVVLAGDHMQISPEVFSTFCKKQNFHLSLLERLMDRYPSDSPYKIMLCENYRSHPAIVDFTSTLFYDSQLIASGNQVAHSKFYPLSFFTTRGEEVQHQNSTGFYNVAEVYEIVERVDELHRKWPEEWGKLDASAIGVVAPYSDQVIRIRAELRKKKFYHVSVERVFNVQGKQFRVIIISTVRTRRTCSSDGSMEDILDYGFLSNVKLLNTAITRAQSLVAVVGDPVSLCLVGKCRKVWEHFLEICNENVSLYGISWSQFRSQLDLAEMRKTYVLNPLAPEFIPSHVYHAGLGMAGGPDPQSMGHVLSMYTSPPHWGAPYMPGFHGYPIPQMFPPYSPYYHPGMVAPRHYLQPMGPHPGRRTPPMKGLHVPKSVSPNNLTMRSRVQGSPESDKGTNSGKQSPVQKDVIRTKSPFRDGKGKAIVMMPRTAYNPYQRMRFPAMGGYYYPMEDPILGRMTMYPPHFQAPGYFPYMPIPTAMYPPYAMDRGFPYHPAGVPMQEVPIRRTVSPVPDRGLSPARAKSSSPSSTASGQQIQLLPNVHTPHLALDGMSSESSTPVQGNSPQRLDSSPTEQSRNVIRTNPGRFQGPFSSRPKSERTGYVEQTPTESSPTASSESLGSYVGTQLDNKVNESHLRLKGINNLHVNTGFSRQFSDDLETPTEVTNLVRMMEESIEEERSFDSDISKTEPHVLGTGPISRHSHLHLPLSSTDPFFPNGQLSMSLPSSDNEKMTYAGVVRRPPPLSQDSPREGIHSSDEDQSYIEPQTPRTPSGFMSFSELDVDPLHLLRNLNISDFDRSIPNKYL